MSSRWVRPTALTKNGKPVYEEFNFNNRFAFETFDLSDGTIMNTLEEVDLIHHNNFRQIDNINPYVDVDKIHIANISKGGKNYKVNDMGVSVVGGYSFTYIVEEVDGDGGVTKMGLVPDDRSSSINLANFDMSDDISGISAVYGTSPTTGSGTGLKFQFYIEYDYYQSIIQTQGEIYDDLFAFVRERSGLYVYQYIINEESSAKPKSGTWTKGQCVSEYEVTSIDKEIGGVSTAESYINSILPSVRDLPIIRHTDNEDPTTIVTLQTSSFINIIDKDVTPVEDPSSTTKNVVDMCKFYCNGIHVAVADEKSSTSVKNKLKELKQIRFDSYILWRWVNPKDLRDKSFEYGIVFRSFNNLMTTDEITMLPTNELTCDDFVHTNGNTTIVWDVEGVGVMMWIYDPTYTKKENYWIDPSTRELHVTRTDMTYADIDINMPKGVDVPPIIDKGIYQFNVMTNNPMCIDDTEMSPIYQQPEMTELDDVVAGGAMMNTSDKHKLCGNWKLVFPRVQSFKLKNDETKTEWIPMKMQTIKGRSISEIGSVNDQYGNDVSRKSLVINEDTDGISINMFNPTTGKWEKI